MADFLTIRFHFESNNVPYFTFYPRIPEAYKGCDRHLPVSTPAEDISDGLVNYGFDVIGVKQTSTTRR
jgi:hypothetical protein